MTPMTQTRWDSMSPEQKDKARDLSDLSPQLVGLEGWRIEVVDRYGEARRFYVGRSTGWRPCHIEISRRDASGGTAADHHYQSIKQLYRR